MLVGRHSSEVLFWSSALNVVKNFLLDLALYQNATQSSTYSEVSKTGEASLAVDGDRRKDWNQGFCTHTNTQKDPWWRVDLGASLPVAEVVIVNRLCTSSGGCSNDMNAFEIRIGKAIFTLLFKI